MRKKTNKNISRRALGSGFQKGSTCGARKLLLPCTFGRSKSSCREGGGWDLFEGGEAANEAVLEQKLAKEGRVEQQRRTNSIGPTRWDQLDS